jgi:hypothetical protein
VTELDPGSKSAVAASVGSGLPVDPREEDADRGSDPLHVKAIGRKKPAGNPRGLT